MRNTYRIVFRITAVIMSLGRRRLRWDGDTAVECKDMKRMGCALGSVSSGYGPVAGSCEHARL
jgi:hypothetical protein